MGSRYQEARDVLIPGGRSVIKVKRNPYTRGPLNQLLSARSLPAHERGFSALFSSLCSAWRGDAQAGSPPPLGGRARVTSCTQASCASAQISFIPRPGRRPSEGKKCRLPEPQCSLPMEWSCPAQ